MTVEAIIKLYATKGFTAREMVALMGALPLQQEHPTDPALNPKFAAALKSMCNNYKTDPTMSAFNDVYTLAKLSEGIGALASDDALVRDPVTKPFVELYAKNQDQFFKDFSLAMEKLSVLGAKTGKKGENVEIVGDDGGTYLHNLYVLTSSLNDSNAKHWLNL
ncbi:hypothetical protein K2173_028111 [Erythroxylum novogranatense]|uniref:peroxidase n=1 Tax=Erythroxylum novogranatense TaxID=1862640 RepID=A0AAV8U486_9ROSI|nr:hypothetical protein K2173_028111 [Erythroxylum novogranatense]